MTGKEIVRVAVGDDAFDFTWSAALVAMIDAAIAAEREACRVIAEGHRCESACRDRGYGHCCDHVIAEQIRARRTP